MSLSSVLHWHACSAVRQSLGVMQEFAGLSTYQRVNLGLAAADHCHSIDRSQRARIELLKRLAQVSLAPHSAACLRNWAPADLPASLQSKPPLQSRLTEACALCIGCICDLMNLKSHGARFWMIGQAGSNNGPLLQREAIRMVQTKALLSQLQALQAIEEWAIAALSHVIIRNQASCLTCSVALAAKPCTLTCRDAFRTCLPMLHFAHNASQPLLDLVTESSDSRKTDRQSLPSL